MSFRTNIIELDSVSSTNNYAANLLRTTELAEGTVVMSRFQTEGRGQRGTTWQSEPGANLLFSLVIKPQGLRAVDQFVLNEAVCLGLIDGIQQLYGVNTAIKWPNDIFMEGRKLAGLLIECGLRGQQVEYAIVGIGLNVNQEVYAEGIEAISLQQVIGRKLSPRSVLEGLLPFIENRYKNRENRVDIERDYLSNLIGYQSQLWYQAGAEKFRAKIVGLGPHGELIVETETGERQNFGFKEITLSRENFR